MPPLKHRGRSRSRAWLAALHAMAISATIAACSTTRPPAPPPPSPTENPYATEGIVITHPGELFTVYLPANHTTGYSWKLAAPLDERIVQLVGQDYDESGSRRAGRGGVERWKFRGVAPGRAEISLEYVGPSGDAAAPAERRIVPVAVES